MDIKSLFQFEDLIKDITTIHSNIEWITIYFDEDNAEQEFALYAGMIRNSGIKEVLLEADWELDAYLPKAYTIDYGDFDEYYEYLKESYELKQQLVVKRSFSNIEKPYFEISEEFRYYFNLYHDIVNNSYHFITGSGGKEEVVKISGNMVEVKLRFIKEFLSIKDMSLVIFYDVMRFSKESLENLGIKEYDQEFLNEDNVYSVYIKNSESGYKGVSQSWFRGKKIIHALKDFNKNKIYVQENKIIDFIIGIDENGMPVHSNIELKDEKTSLKPVFFKKEVLLKYYSNTQKYGVGDGYIECRGKWRLAIDNNMPEHVMVFLHKLVLIPYEEKMYWKSFNILPTHKISSTEWKRKIEGEFCDPESLDLRFKSSFEQFQRKWKNKFGWNLFKPLNAGDQHHFDSLRIPITKEQKEFDEQILSITKIFIDSLNERELEKGLAFSKVNPRGIDKFEKYLESNKINIPEMLEFLRKLQNLRSSSTAHRKGENYEGLKKYFEIDKKKLDEVTEGIFLKLIWTLNTLTIEFLKN